MIAFQNRAVLFLLLVLMLVLPGVAPTVAAEPLPRVVQFNRDIRPILSDNCFQCHGPDAQARESSLRLDQPMRTINGLRRDGTIRTGTADASDLIARIVSRDADECMPPPSTNKHLTEREIELLRLWIDQGTSYQEHWSFLPIRTDRPPETESDWVKNPLDRFVLAQLQQHGLTPSPPADPNTLIKRLYLDLIGLLPDPKSVDAFLGAYHSDPDNAVRSLALALLESPHYGERWGRHWLDQARYADSHGYTIDGDRIMWPYRDWVIAAINADMPFDQFTIEQLAGDMLPNATKAQLIATGFHRNTLVNQEGGTDAEQFRNEEVVDRVNTTGAVWLGLTVGCAQCHSHKFDPISQREYFRLFAFFNHTVDVNNIGPTVMVSEGELLRGKIGLGKPVAAMVMRELAEPRPTYIHVRGDFLRVDKETGLLTPGVPAVLPSLPTVESDPTRLDFARWLVAKDNPLTARVTVNRVWMHYFGRGLVETENDFGTQGSFPTHRKLLDWLAGRFIESQWSMKQLHELIVTSATYRQASQHRTEAQDVDPINTLLGRQNRLRVDAEIIRDVALSASGLLDPKVGGPSVRPPQPDGIYAFTQTKKSWTADTDSNRFRRAIYTRFYRSAPYPMLTTFDAPDFQSVCTRRTRSNTPLQSLTMANDKAFFEMSQGLAARLLGEVKGEDEQANRSRVQRAFQICYCRPAEDDEIEAVFRFQQRQAKLFEADFKSANRVAPTQFPESYSATFAASWTAVARAMMNTDEFVTRE